MVSSTFLDFFYSGQPDGPLRQLQELGYYLDSKLPDNAEWRFEPSFYNSLEFLSARIQSGLRQYYLIQVVGEGFYVVGVITFQVDGNEAISLSGAPFGGLERSPDLPDQVLKLFLQQVIANLQQLVRHLEVKMPATGISDQFARVNAALQAAGFMVEFSEVNHHLPAREHMFEENLHPSAKRRLRKLEQHNFIFDSEPETEAATIYEFVKRCRQEKGYYLSLSFKQLKEAMAAAPGRYYFFAVRQEGKLAAATIGVKSAADVLYNYAPAHDAAYNAFSPVILLTRGLVNWCAENGFRLLDLGTSSINGQPNLPLITFKEHLGGVASEKQTWVKEL